MAHMVRLNVGGQRFEVGRSTLSRVGGYLATLIEAAEEEEVFVDRDPTLFRFILGWLRDGDNAVLPATAVDRYTALQKKRCTCNSLYWGIWGTTHMLAILCCKFLMKFDNFDYHICQTLFLILAKIRPRFGRDWLRFGQELANYGQHLPTF